MRAEKTVGDTTEIPMAHRKETPEDGQPATEKVTPSPHQPRTLEFGSVSVEDDDTIAFHPDMEQWAGNSDS